MINHTFDEVLELIKQTEIKNKNMSDDLKNELEAKIKKIKLETAKLKEKNFKEIEEKLNVNLKNEEQKLIEILQKEKDKITKDVAELKKQYFNKKDLALEFLIKGL